jgi:hypothetical protein
MAFLTMEVPPRRYLIWETRLVKRFPCKSARFSASRIFSLKDPERPRKPPNLSPEPSPNGARACRRSWQQAGRDSGRPSAVTLSECSLARVALATGWTELLTPWIS